jgi:pyruvate dehydrogenase E1 component alpha subunit
MHGKGGSMHLLDASRGILGAYAIVGAQLVIANGAAWSAQYRGTGQVTVCFLGDGATNIGAFHEALNLAATWKLPVVFVCENNQYMEYTPISAVTAVASPAAGRAASYGLEPVVVDGNDVEAVYACAAVAIGRARDGGGPALIEALTYRHGGHSRADPGKYRPADEVKEWLARDPVPAYRRVLLGRGAGEAALDAIDRAAREASPRAGAGGRGRGMAELKFVEVVMPRMGETVDEGTVTTWLKAAGEPVAEGEPLLEISTDKVDTEIPAPAGGVLTEIRVAEGQTVAVATVLAVIKPDS